MTDSSNSAPDFNDSYTDSPPLYANLFWGSLQVLFWLLFHPSAWRNHLTQIAPDLSPNFSLTDIDRANRHNQSLQRLLVMGYLILPVLASIPAGAILWAVGTSGRDIILGVGIGLLLGVGVAVMGSWVTGTAVSIVLGVVVGGVSGIGAGVGLGMGIPATVSSELDLIRQATTLSIAFGLLFGFGGSLIGGLANSVTSRRDSPPLNRQLVSILVGTPLTGVVLFLGGQSLASEQVPIIVIGPVAGVLVGLAISWRRNRLAGLASGSIVFVALLLANLAPGDTALNAVLFVSLVIPAYVLIEGLAAPWPAAVVSAFGGGTGWIASAILASRLPLWPFLPLSMFSLIAGLNLFFLRPILTYLPFTIWNTLLRRLDEGREAHQASLLHCHAAFWDELQPFRWFGLEEYLQLILERHPTDGRQALEFLAVSRQRWAAQATQIEVDARWLEACTTVEVIGSVHHSLAAGELDGPASALLRSFSRISRDVEAALRQESEYNQRLALSAVEDRLDRLLRELTRSSEPYAARFQPIVIIWRKTVSRQVATLAQAVEAKQAIENPYIIGIPLTEQQEVFIGRTDISSRIERLILDQRQPPLLLYGQRRMGKTSLLNNLGRLLPSTIIPLFVDLQGPVSWTNDYAGFLYNLARAMLDSAQRQRALSLPPLSRETLSPDPFTTFDEWLDQVETSLGQDHTLLLALDEFEALDSALKKGRFDEEAILGTLRHLIQHRSTIKVLLAGSHSLDELHRWANYLINTQTIRIGPLTEAEATQLIERPVEGFALRYEPEASRQVFHLTQGHPFLIQLLCSEIVTYKNEQAAPLRRIATLDDVEIVIPEVLSRGSLFFADIEQNQISPQALPILRLMARQPERTGTSPARLAEHVNHLNGGPDLDQLLQELIRRELIEPTPTGYRFCVPLIQRWFL